MNESDVKPLTLSEIPCTQLKGVGKKIAEQLAKRQIYTIQDLLFHLPMRYQDRTRVTPIANLRRGDHAVIEGTVQSTHVKWGKKPSLMCCLEDGSGRINLRFFHFSAAQQQNLSQGTILRCFGEVRANGHETTMIHPEYKRVNPGEILHVEETLTPIYPSTEGLSQTMWRNLSEQALQLLAEGGLITEYLPDALREQFALEHVAAAIHYVHRPPPDACQSLLEEGKHMMQQRLAFEELIAHCISMRRVRQHIQQYPGIALPATGDLREQFLARLPFALTAAQTRVVADISHDLTQSAPMLRLVQGDVGSGKTVVAVLAILQAVAHQSQAVLMAPTEILGEQHYHNFCQWLNPLGIEVAWLAGKLTGKKRQAALAQLASGEAQVIVGTHALFQADVHYHNLALVVVDEQHRFGVHQRMALRDKADLSQYYPHQLIMTATPIPRTLSMTVYADLDCSIIDELPPGRSPITTVAVPNARREEVIERVRQACQQQSQAYWVCTLIEESDVLQCQAAEATAEELGQHLPELAIGLIHGRMSAAEKEQVMARFKAGELHVLVATTVIEVGVDVPNASLMIIENPERLGLAQLHQLRGRVGRGQKQSHCVLLYQAPLSEHAHSRLAILRESNDGFVIAQRDLELRGPGEVLGTRQTGLMRLRIADLMRDARLLPKVQHAADQLLVEHPQQVELLIKRWLGENEQYAIV